MFCFFHKCHVSQSERLLEFFKKNKGVVIPLPRILDIRPRFAHHTELIRILRERGYDIECHTYWRDGIHCSDYTFNGINLKPRVKHEKKTYTKEDIDKSYEKGYQACLIQFTK